MNYILAILKNLCEYILNDMREITLTLTLTLTQEGV